MTRRYDAAIRDGDEAFMVYPSSGTAANERVFYLTNWVDRMELEELGWSLWRCGWLVDSRASSASSSAASATFDQFDESHQRRNRENVIREEAFGWVLAKTVEGGLGSLDNLL